MYMYIIIIRAYVCIHAYVRVHMCVCVCVCIENNMYVSECVCGAKYFHRRRTQHNTCYGRTTIKQVATRHAACLYYTCAHTLYHYYQTCPPSSPRPPMSSTRKLLAMPN